MVLKQMGPPYAERKRDREEKEGKEKRRKEGGRKERNLYSSLKAYPKINSKWIIDLNVKL